MPIRPLSILHLISSERWTGVADPALSVARLHAQAGHHVRVACIGGYTLEAEVRKTGLPVITSLKLDRRLHPYHLFSDFRELRRLAAEHRFDVIHTHLLHDNWLAALATKRYPQPYLLARTMHRFEWPRRDPLHKWLFCQRIDHVFTSSEAMKGRIISRLGLPGEKVDVIRGGVDQERFHPNVDSAPIRAEFGIPPDAPVAGIVSRLREGRGHDWLLRAAPEALLRAPLTHILIVGRGEIKHRLRAQIAAMPMGARIHMAGYRSGDLPQAYAAMTCSMFLGQGSEGSCRAILEAMACGRPVIGARCGGVAEVIEPGVTGELVDEQDTRGLTEALVRLLSDPAGAAEMGRRARRACETRFSETRRAEKVMQGYATAWRRKYGRSLF